MGSKTPSTFQQLCDINSPQQANEILRLESALFCNMEGTGDDDVGDGTSFIAWWKKHTGLSSPPCSELSCPGRGEHGGHVSLIVPHRLGAFIVPLCTSHNNPQNESPMEPKPGTLFVRLHGY